MYGTLTQLKSEIGVTDAAQDTYLTDLLTAASAWIEAETGQQFSAGPITVTNEVYYKVKRVIWLRHIGISAVTKVEYKYTSSEPYTEFGVDDYIWGESGRLELYGGYYANEFEHNIPPGIYYPYVRVTYTYAGTGVPADITRIAIETAANMYRNNGDNDTVSSKQVGDLKITYRDASKAASSDLVESLKAYRVQNV